MLRSFEINKRILHLALCLAFVLVCFCGAYSIAFAEGETPGETSAELTPANDIPLVIVRVDESTTSIDDMNGSYDHSVRCESATVEIKLPENYQPPEGYTTAVPAEKTVLKYVRGRGNSTWARSKKPYKLELNAAADFFGMGASTDWALIANSFDSSLIRNRITFWLGEQMGLEFTPKQVPVDLVMIGDKTGEHWYGSYYLCETIKIEENRINIGKLKKNDTENITGGYLLAIYTEQEHEDESTWFTTNHGVDILNDSPDFLIEPEKPLTEARIAQRDYIRGYMQEVEDLIMNAELKDGKITAEAHKKIDEKMDLKSAADYWLLQEIPFNTDGYATPSTYMYKARDGKLYWGPLWDCDYCWWNNAMPWTESHDTFNNTSMLWIDYLRDKDPLFVQLLNERWAVLNEKLQDLTKEGGIIEQYTSEVRKSQKADYEIWKDKTGDYQGTTEEAFDQEIVKMKNWIDARRSWANANLSELDHVYCLAEYKLNDKVVATERVRYNNKPVMNPDVQVPEGYVLESWVKGRKDSTDYVMTEDTVFEAKLVEESKAVKPEKLNIQLPESYMVDGKATVDISKSFFPVIGPERANLDQFAYADPYGSVTNPRITWTSSNEKIGVIDPVNHRVILKAGGDITITGTLHNGVSASFVLHVNGPAPEPDKIVKAANPLKIGAKTASVKYRKLKKKTQTLAVTRVIKFTKKVNDKKTYTLSSAKKGSKSFKKYFRINKTSGKVTVKKGLKKGTYNVKVKVKAAGNSSYEASAVKTVTFKVKVK